MKILDYIRQRVLKLLGIEHLAQNPKSERFTFLSSDENIKKQKLKENRVWYYGDSDELLNFYTTQFSTNNSEPIYNRNRKNYFWSISTTEANIKRVHSGIPNAIVSTLVNVIGVPKVTVDGEEQPILEKIIKENNMVEKINQQQMPLTLAEGWGAFKVSTEAGNDIPVVQYYDAENVEFVYKSGKLIGIIYKDYYKQDNKDYVLFETRRIDDINSYIEYELFRLKDNDEAEPCELTDIEELSELQNIVMEGFPLLLGVASKYFFDIYNKEYGKSIFTGKIDLFDDLDQILSQDSQTVRVSTPVEYYPNDLLEKGKNGEAKLPNVYNRQYIAKETGISGDGSIDGTIQTTQPTLNFNQYSEDAKSKLDYILTGILSPATMGIDIAKKDNAEAQREKEKVTIMTRNNIIAKQTDILKALYNLCLHLYHYKTTDTIEIKEYKIGVVFDEFANPSFENQLSTLGTAWANGTLSTERYVELLWGDKLTKDEKAKEVKWLDENRQKDTLTFDDFGGDLNGTGA